MTEQTIVIDAQGTPLGRLASHAAKQALLGKKVVITNCNNAIIIGQPLEIVARYIQNIQRGKGRAMKGPFFPRIPFRIVKRTARGMLSYTQKRGLDALKRIICYNDTPKEFESAKKISFASEPKTKSIKLSDLCRRLS